MTKKDYNTDNLKDIELEELIKETEQKILDNNYYEDCTVTYKNLRVHIRIKPINQLEFTRISRNHEAFESAEFCSLIMKECVLNKANNEPFTLEQINKLFTGGLAMAITEKCMEVSGITLSKAKAGRLRNF